MVMRILIVRVGVYGIGQIHETTSHNSQTRNIGTIFASKMLTMWVCSVGTGRRPAMVAAGRGVGGWVVQVMGRELCHARV